MGERRESDPKSGDLEAPGKQKASTKQAKRPRRSSAWGSLGNALVGDSSGLYVNLDGL